MTVENIEALGGGWVGEEALAIAVFCALHAEQDFRRGVLAAVNHSGDSDSTGAITGNILGVLLGRSAIPDEWREGLDLADVVEQIARDLYALAEAGGAPEDEAWRERYPPY